MPRRPCATYDPASALPAGFASRGPSLRPKALSSTRRPMPSARSVAPQPSPHDTFSGEAAAPSSIRPEPRAQSAPSASFILRKCRRGRPAPRSMLRSRHPSTPRGRRSAGRAGPHPQILALEPKFSRQPPTPHHRPCQASRHATSAARTVRSIRQRLRGRQFAGHA